MFTQVYPVFHQRYPKIVINVKETSVRTQQRLIAKGELDVGFVTLRDFQRTADTYQQIRTEELVLVVPSGHPACKKARPGPGAFYFILRNSRGVTPVAFLNMAIKWLASVNPVLAAIC